MKTPVRIVRFISPLSAIRSALGDLGYPNYMQTMEPDLIRWCIEAEDLITERKFAMKFDTLDFHVDENKINYCEDFLALACVSRGNQPLTYQPGGGCPDAVNCGCSAFINCGPQKYTVDECYIHFTPPLADGTKITVLGYRRPYSEDGYPMVAEPHVVAIQEYVKWKLCFRLQDQRSQACEGRWYMLCRQARALTNNWTQEDLEALGYRWYGRSHVIKPYYGNYNNYFGPTFGPGTMDI